MTDASLTSVHVATEGLAQRDGLLPPREREDPAPLHDEQHLREDYASPLSPPSTEVRLLRQRVVARVRGGGRNARQTGVLLVLLLDRLLLTLHTHSHLLYAVSQLEMVVHRRKRALYTLPLRELRRLRLLALLLFLHLLLLLLAPLQRA